MALFAVNSWAFQQNGAISLHYFKAIMRAEHLSFVSVHAVCIKQNTLPLYCTLPLQFISCSDNVACHSVYLNSSIPGNKWVFTRW